MPNRRGRSLSERTLHRKNGTPLPGSVIMPFRNLRRIKQQMREDGPQKQLRAAWTTPILNRRYWPGSTHTPLQPQVPPGGEDFGAPTGSSVWTREGGGHSTQGRGGHSTHPYWHDMGQTPKPLTSAAGQVRLGNLSPRSTVWDRHPPGGIGNDHCPQSALVATPQPCGCLP